MASTNAVWGIDIGQCALKAMRCRANDDPDKITVEAFDFIEYPKILTQPDANPTELVADAIKQFLSRNSVRNDRIAMSVSGQSGLARFIKLPPVETKKIPDIVRYEARQQIPFDLNDVIWDYQRMGGGSEEEGFVLETEIGLFAMKRDAVFRALEPLQKAGVEIDIVQLAPLALYNYVLFDQLRDLPSADEYDPENPPESVVIVSLGTDSTDLVVTNGFRVWQRSVPIGGSHFTKALTKDLKLTFAKAEHLKRNATTAQDPKAVFQAMRPVFNDLQTELQRSLGYFTNIDRAAKIGRVVALGNAFKLPGLRRYLAQSLGFEIDRVESFHGMVGPEVLSTPAFKENILSFGVCYGLALQGLNRGGLRTNLLPKEITQERLIRLKKPWAVAAAAMVMLGLTISYAARSLVFDTVKKPVWSSAEASASSILARSNSLKSKADETLKKFHDDENIGKHLVANVQGRNRWLELMAALDTCLPTDDPQLKAQPAAKDPVARSKQVMERNHLIITSLDSQPVEDAAKWFAAVRPYYEKPAGGAGADNSANPASQPGAASGVPAAGGDGPAGPAVIVQIAGHHYHNLSDPETIEFVRLTLMKALASKRMQDAGVTYPVLIKPEGMVREQIVIPAPVRNMGEGTRGGPGLTPMVDPGAGGEPAQDERLDLKRFNFRVQFVWKPSAEQPGAQADAAASTRR